jgi:nicotinate-nucleotide adenylyltransferase
VSGARIGLLGGSFNPVHLAHLRVAEEIRERYALDQVRLIPAATPPHKAAADLVPGSHRLRMVELAVEGASALVASPMEIDRGGISYTIDTIRQVLCEVPRPSALVLIVGIDTFRDMRTWKEHGAIFGHCDVAVVSRPGCSATFTLDDFPVAIRGCFCYDPLRDCFRHDSRHITALHEVIRLDISATEIRRQVRAGRSIRYLVPSPVEDYIHRHRLYRAQRRYRRKNSR